MSQLITPEEFRYYGVTIIQCNGGGTGQFFKGGREKNWSASSRDLEEFKAHFGSTPLVCSIVWKLLNKYELQPPGGCAFHMLWALLFMKIYSNQLVLAKMVGADPKTFGKWSCLFVNAIHKLQPFVVS